MSFPDPLPLAGSGVTATTLALLLQVGRVAPDTLVTVQATPTGFAYWADLITSVATVILAVAIIGGGIIAVPTILIARKVLIKLNRILSQVQTDVAPLIKHAHAVAENVNYVSTVVRMDVEQLSQTVQAANHRLVDTAKLAEQRINEFNALMRVVQEEAEDLFIGTASTVRGVRAGAETLRRLRTDEDPAAR